ncbi:MAG: translation protein SH3-like domain-containing protein [Piptocephalis tieghemiana]|nr:MAG: translation protein SH3-like domain-containing protein [Piptocephalis tieghemiana]
MSTLRSAALRMLKAPKRNKQTPIKRWKISKDDEVMIIDGKNAGEIGRVKDILREENQVRIAGQNMVWKKNILAPGKRVQKEVPIHISRVALLHPETRKPIKVAFREILDEETGKMRSMRVVQGTNEVIPRPPSMVDHSSFQETVFDTKSTVVSEVTYTPSMESNPLPPGVVDELRNKYGKQRVPKEKRRRQETAKYVLGD